MTNATDNGDQGSVPEPKDLPRRPTLSGHCNQQRLGDPSVPHDIHVLMNSPCWQMDTLVIF